MSRWKELPDSLDPRVRQLVVHLRRLKDHSGLGLAALAARTGYSRSSWDRYLNGKVLPPAEAVEALAVTCGTEPARLLALHEVASQAERAEPPEQADRSEQDVRTEETAGETAGRQGERQRQPVPWLAIVLSSACTALVILAVLAFAAPWEGERRDAPVARPDTGETHPKWGEFDYKVGEHYDCAVQRGGDGRLYAGYSRTRSELIEKLSTRWSVVETQCLLKHHEVTPGAIDGAFGNDTERAVKRFQDRAKVAVDGKVGPDTWKVLRK